MHSLSHTDHTDPCQPPDRDCLHCGKRFTPQRYGYQQRYCCRGCAARGAFALCQHRWTPEEEAFIEERAGLMPPAWIAQEFNDARLEHGWPPRTEAAIRLRLNRLGLNAQTELDNLTIQQVADLLGVNFWTVRRWKNDLGLKAIKVNSRRHAVPLRALRFFFLACPWEARGIDESVLEWLMEGFWPKLKAMLPTAAPPRSPGRPKPVRTYDPRTRKVCQWRSIKAAADYIGVADNAIRYAADAARPCQGVWVQWADLPMVPFGTKQPTT